MQENRTDSDGNSAYLKIMAKTFVRVLAGSVVIFMLAGRLSYWQGWLFGATYMGLNVAVAVLFADKKDVIFERARPGPGTKWWDKIFFWSYLPTALCIIVIAGLDAGRFGWTAPLPPAVCVISYVILVLSFATVLWAMWTNKFFSRVVRIQSDRGHYVIQEGPYRFVRHPGYLSGIFILPSTALVLGSLWALIPAALAVTLLIIRTYLEDATLQKELPGYADYAQMIRSRLLPGIW
jgi:protein-S-isoprenylcysteine O-methyltransferase Ste14